MAIGTLLFAFVLFQAPPCSPRDNQHVQDGTARARVFDLPGAANAYAQAAPACAEAQLAAHYLRGLAAARRAYAQGGSAESLAPVKLATDAIDALEAALPALVPIARVLLQAAAASAQSERDQMSILLEHATRLEAVQLEAAQPGLPGVTAHEAAGDLWLQVHGYEEARRAYLDAAARVGMTPRVHLGLARVAARLKDGATACAHYREVAAAGRRGADPPPELVEARDYLAATPSCTVAAAPPASANMANR